MARADLCATRNAAANPASGFRTARWQGTSADQTEAWLARTQPVQVLPDLPDGTDSLRLPAQPDHQRRLTGHPEARTAGNRGSGRLSPLRGNRRRGTRCRRRFTIARRLQALPTAPPGSCSPKAPTRPGSAPCSAATGSSPRQTYAPTRSQNLHLPTREVRAINSSSRHAAARTLCVPGRNGSLPQATVSAARAERPAYSGIKTTDKTGAVSAGQHRPDHAQALIAPRRTRG